jgi:hypothetical protein
MKNVFNTINVDKSKAFLVTNNPKPFQSPMVQNPGHNAVFKKRKGGGHVH